MVGKKIAVVGVSAAGKSTFARKLAAKTGLPLVHIDSHMWRPGWNFVGKEEIAKKLDELSNNPEWIIEGYLVEQARPIVLTKADTIIFLNYSAAVAAWRYIKRWWKHRTHPRPELEGSPEKFSFKFLELSWTKAELSYLGELLAQQSYKEKLVLLSSPKQAEEFLKSL
jgi:adenylate kinase family enzyme